MPYTGPLEDRILIRETMETYAHGVMTKDAVLWASTWADDAFWALPEFPDLEGFSGKEAIVAGWVASMDVYGLDGGKKPMVYVATPGSIEVDGTTAKAVSYTSEIFDDPESGKTLRVRGRYDDVLEKVDGRWLFTRREYRVLHMA
ncbi:nuclear transport factor 2 family protein [Novosphingobium sp. KCTC 2891]|uniref:nuclear transport factor 2 family protein n=1 Tax=Novosphingobium sp. KCTC 2891 TaxID=2989730 RepID=UPI002223B767|nr:nuclear transport factor 2 family protein [Novosphingobium sp. KCTC 2891]MCW1382761.1 nuclear transport factor 2 family protein [Novosphingobium sp. KCTC 2891]